MCNYVRYPAGRSRDFADNISENDVMICRVVDHLAPLAILSETHIVTLEWVGYATGVRLFAVAE